jgi:hypothetical protein
MLTLFEELFLLAIHEAKGTLIGLSVEQLKPGLVGAALAELALMNKIQTSDNHRLKLADANQTDDIVLNETLDLLKESEKERKFGYWINTLSNKTDKITKRITKSLVQKGIVNLDDDRFVWAIPSPVHPEVNASEKYYLVRKLRGIVLAQEESQPRDIVLLSLVRACDLLGLVFLRDERKLASQYINKQLFSHAVMDPLIQTVQEIETALAAAVEED